MEKIIPIAGATGAHSYAPTKADPPSVAGDQDQESDHSSLQTPTGEAMNVDSTS